MNAPWQTLSPEERVAWHARGWRRALPLLFALLSALITTVPIFGPAPLTPALPLLCVIVWSLYQPGLMPPWAAVLVGLATDLAQASPLGVNATLMPALTLVLRDVDARLGPRSFALDWAMIGPILILYQLLAWGVLALMGAMRDPLLLVPQAIISWVIFPAMARGAVWAQRRIGFD